MYLVFNRFLEIEKEEEREAITTARLNSAAVLDYETGKIIEDNRTEESENDERG